MVGPACTAPWPVELKSGDCSGQGGFEIEGPVWKGPGSVGNWWLNACMRGFEQLPLEAKEMKWQAVPAGRITLRPGRGSAGARWRGAEGVDSSASNQEGASLGWRDKLGVSLFRETGEEVEQPGYCVLCAHAAFSQDALGEPGGTGFLPGGLLLAPGDP